MLAMLMLIKMNLCILKYEGMLNLTKNIYFLVEKFHLIVRSYKYYFPIFRHH